MYVLLRVISKETIPEHSLWDVSKMINSPDIGIVLFYIRSQSESPHAYGRELQITLTQNKFITHESPSHPHDMVQVSTTFELNTVECVLTLDGGNIEGYTE